MRMHMRSIGCAVTVRGGKNFLFILDVRISIARGFLSSCAPASLRSHRFSRVSLARRAQRGAFTRDMHDRENSMHGRWMRTIGRERKDREGGQAATRTEIAVSPEARFPNERAIQK